MKCFFCGSENAYQGLYHIECPNVSCKHFSNKQLSIITEEAKKKQEENDKIDISGYDSLYDRDVYGEPVD